MIKDLKEDQRFMSSKSGAKTRSLKQPGTSKKSSSADSQSKPAALSNNQSNAGVSSKSSRKLASGSSCSPSKSKISSVRKSRTYLFKKTAVESLRAGNLSGASTESIDSSGHSDGWSSISSLDMVAKGASSFGYHGNGGELLNFDTESVSSALDDVADDQGEDFQAEIEIQLMNFNTDVEFAEPELFTCELIPILEFNFSLPDSY